MSQIFIQSTEQAACDRDLAALIRRCDIEIAAMDITVGQINAATLAVEASPLRDPKLRRQTIERFASLCRQADRFGVRVARCRRALTEARKDGAA